MCAISTKNQIDKSKRWLNLKKKDERKMIKHYTND